MGDSCSRSIFLPFFLVLKTKSSVSQSLDLSLLPHIEQLQNYNIQVMENLVESHRTSQEVLLKVAAGIICKYEVHQIDNIFSFLQDSNQAIQEMKLYSHTLSQLYLETGKESTQLFTYYHSQIFRIVDFLLKTIQKIHNKNQARNPPQSQAVHCANCQHLIHQRNVRNMQRQILDYHRYSAQMLDQDLRWEQQEDNNYEEDETICSEAYFRKNMFVIQKNIEDRQNNILECIVDFQQLRSNLMGEMQRRKSVGDVHAFNMREHLQAVTQNFMVNLRKIELKINSLRRHSPINEEKGVQTTSNQEETDKSVPAVVPLKTSIRSQADFKKVSSLNSKLHEASRKAQNQINALTVKVEALESQNKKLREQIFVQKMKNCKQRSTKNVQKQEEKSKRQQGEKHKKTLLIDNLQSIFCESADFGCDFTTTLQQSFNQKDLSLSKQEDPLPIIKSVFQKTLEKYTNRKSSLFFSLQKKRSLQDQEEFVELKRNKSRKKSIRMQMEVQAKETSRFSMKKTQKKEFQVTNVFSLKLAGEKHHYSMSSISQSSLKNTLKDTAHSFNQNQKKKKLAKLSIFSDLKQQSQQSKSTVNRAPKLRQKTDYSPQQFSQHFVTSNLASSKVFKKSTFRRNKSQEDIIPTPKKQQAYRVIRLKEKDIDVKVVRSFLLLNDQLGMANEKQNRFNVEQRSRHVFEYQADMKIQRQKIVLTLDELNYLTLLFSVFARVHLVNINVYTQIKEWILSSPKMKSLQDSSQSLVMRKVVSEIISRHRPCSSRPHLCNHLTDFLEAVQRFLTGSEWDDVDRAKDTLIK